jgi:tRNA(Arg) A34 adenosine deaminase TadA
MFSASESPLLTHEHWMREALRAAHEARAAGEVPVGTCVVSGDELLSVAGNRTRTNCDPTAHAEVVALREAARKLGNYRLPKTVVYSTIEPCAMCAGADQARFGWFWRASRKAEPSDLTFISATPVKESSHRSGQRRFGV